MSRADRSAARSIPRWLSPSHRDHPRNRSSVMTRHRPARGGATRELLRGPGSARRRAFGSTLWLRADVLQPAGEVTANAGGASLGALAARHRQRKTDDLSRAPPAAGARPPRHHERSEAGYPDRPQQSFAEERQERAGHQQSDPTVTSGHRAPPRGACCSSTVGAPSSKRPRRTRPMTSTNEGTMVTLGARVRGSGALLGCGGLIRTLARLRADGRAARQLSLRAPRRLRDRPPASAVDATGMARSFLLLVVDGGRGDPRRQWRAL